MVVDPGTPKAETRFRGGLTKRGAQPPATFRPWSEKRQPHERPTATIRQSIFELNAKNEHAKEAVRGRGGTSEPTGSVCFPRNHGARRYTLREATRAT